MGADPAFPGRGCLQSGDATTAVNHARSALETPESLGEARHPLANPAQLLLVLGTALEADNDPDGAVRCWREAAEARGDFSDRAPVRTPRTPTTQYWPPAGSVRRSTPMRWRRAWPPTLSCWPDTRQIDYFATSLPALLLFDDDPQAWQDLAVELLRAQLALLAGDRAGARRHLDTVLDADPSHELALDLVRGLEHTRSLS